MELLRPFFLWKISYNKTDETVFSFTNFKFKVYISNNYTLCSIQFMLKLDTWFDGHLVRAQKPKWLKLCLIFNITRTKSSWNKHFWYSFVTVWEVLLLWMNSYIYWLRGDECPKSFGQIFLKLSHNFHYDFILIFMQKSISSWIHFCARARAVFE